MTIIKNVPLEAVLKDKNFVLLDIKPRYKYVGKDKTDTILGHTYTIVGTISFQTINVGVEGVKPVIDINELQELRSKGENIMVSLKGAVVSPYYNYKAGVLADSITAVEIKLVNKGGVSNEKTS